MVSIGQLAAFALASFVLVVIPGPSVLFVIGRALAHGRRVALASVVGNAVGVYLVAVAVALGLGPVVQRSELAFAVLKAVGAVYLCYLGVQAIRRRRELATAFSGSGAPRGPLRCAWDGFVVGVANPKAFILFAAILPQFVNRSAGHVPVQMMLLGVVSFVIAVASDSIWALVASTVRAWFARSPRRLDVVGVTVATTGRRTDRPYVCPGPRRRPAAPCGPIKV